VMTGSPDALPLVQAAAAMTGDTLEVRRLERRLPLRAAPRPVGIRAIAAGDAVIAFSRRAAMALREELQAQGHEVAMVYGNLAPDVRRSEAARFRTGHADVLVATDAIGMGLNLPIRRVVFSSLSKFDGRSQRDLTASEIRQIAGRAGRFGGPADEGVCAVMPGSEPRRLAQAIEAAPGAAADLRLYVRPSLSAVLAVAGREPVLLAPILAHLRDNLVAGHPELRMADIDGMVEAAAFVDRHALPLATRYAYASCPLASAESDDLRVLDAWARAHAAGERVPCPDLDADDLAAAEVSGRRMMAYCWMARRFPSEFAEAEAAADRRALAEEAVEGFLRENPWRRGPRRAA
jgi:ATP-dependent RNA helicase SUPV3L1/SUV3